MVRIRLQRFGKKKNPFYRIVCADSRSPRDGKFIDILGFWDPKKKIFKIDTELYLSWLKKGSQPTDAVLNLVKNFKVLEKSSSDKDKNEDDMKTSELASE
jgi:small subunit ribosomal protein S16